MKAEMGILAKAMGEYSKKGLKGVLHKVLLKTRKYVFYTTKSTWYQFDMADSLTRIDNMFGLDCEFLVSDKSTLIEWLKVNHSIYPWIYFEKEIESAIRNDHVFAVVSHKKSFVGYIKVGIGSTYIHDFDVNIVFPPRTAFVYDTFVLPEWRGKNVAVYALLTLADYLKHRGFERILCHIEDWNQSSVRTFSKAYFYPRNTVRFIRIAEMGFYVLDRRRLYRKLEPYVAG